MAIGRSGPSKNLKNNFSELCVLCKTKNINPKVFSAIVSDPAVQRALGEIFYQIGNKSIPVPAKCLKRLQKKQNQNDFITLVNKIASKKAKTAILKSKRGRGLLEVLKFALPIVATLLA